MNDQGVRCADDLTWGAAPLPEVYRFGFPEDGIGSVQLKETVPIYNTVSRINPQGRSGRSSALPYPPMW